MILVREAGGIGDVISCTAAALRLKQERPDEKVSLALPDEFVNFASFFAGPDKIIGLGPLKEILPIRRPRDAEMLDSKYPYLLALPEDEEWKSLWCPAYTYECSCNTDLVYNRPQLFAMACGCQSIQGVSPALLDFTLPTPRSKEPTIILAPRGTCSCRSLPRETTERLVEMLAAKGYIVYLADCLDQKIPIRDTSLVKLINLDFQDLLIYVRSAWCVVSVDSMMLHLAAAAGRPIVGLFGPTDGQNTLRTYRKAVAVQGRNTACPMPCNYNPAKGWDKERCRGGGCDSIQDLGTRLEEIVTRVEEKVHEER